MNKDFVTKIINLGLDLDLSWCLWQNEIVIGPSVCMIFFCSSGHPSVHPSIHLVRSFVCWFAHCITLHNQPSHPRWELQGTLMSQLLFSTCSSIGLSVHSSVCPSVHSSVCPSVCPFILPTVCLFACLFVPSVCSSVHLFVCLFIRIAFDNF